MDHDLIAYFDERFSAMSKQISAEISALREETIQRFKQIDRRFEQIDRRFEQLETTIRQTQVMVEGLRSDMQLVAEGMMGVGERMEALQGNVSLRLDEVQHSITPYYRDLNRRMSVLEGHSERETTDVMTLIRKRWARTQTP